MMYIPLSCLVVPKIVCYFHLLKFRGVCHLGEKKCQGMQPRHIVIPLILNTPSTMVPNMWVFVPCIHHVDSGEVGPCWKYKRGMKSDRIIMFWSDAPCMVESSRFRVSASGQDFYFSLDRSVLFSGTVDIHARAYYLVLAASQTPNRFKRPNDRKAYWS